MNDNKTVVTNYLVSETFRDTIDSGSIWYTWPAAWGKPSPRVLLEITNRDTEKTILCEGLYIDENYEKYFNREIGKLYKKKPRPLKHPVLVMSEYYRRRLEIPSEKSGGRTTNAITLKAHFGFKPFERISAALFHPNLSNRVAVWIGIFSSVLSVFWMVFDKNIPCLITKILWLLLLVFGYWGYKIYILLFK